MRIPHSKPTISSIDKKNVLATLESGFVGQGKQVEKVNGLFSEIFNKETSYFVNSGTSAFFLALKGLNIKEEDEIILPNYLCGSIYAQIKSLKAIPVVIDTIADSFFVSADTVLKAITPKTKAIVVNHPFGHFEPAILEIRKTKIPVIEDVTHSIFAKNGNTIAGTLSDVTIVSFGSTKFITSGTGGVVSFSSKNQAIEVEKLLDHDYNKFSAREGEIRFNYKMGDLNASLLLGQFELVGSLVKKRIQMAEKYYKQLKIPVYPSKFIEGSVYYRFFVQGIYGNSNIIRLRLIDNNIDCAQGAVSLLSRIFALTERFPNSEKIWSELISIPIYPGLKPTEFGSIVKVLNKI